MPTKKYLSGKQKPSAGAAALNAAIIVLSGIVILLLIIYLYTFFSGNDFFKKLGADLPWSAADVTEPKVIVSAQTGNDDPVTEAVVSAVPQAPSSAPAEGTSAAAGNVPDVPEETTVTRNNPTNYSDDFFSNSLFIGDSIFTGLTGFEYLPAENVFAQVGLNPESAATKEVNGITAIQKASSMQPDKIVIMLGTNGLAYMSVEYMDTEMGELVDSIKAVCPYSDIIILSIPPVTRAHEAENPEKISVIKEYNEKLEITAANKGCRYIDIYSILEDGNGYLSADYAEVDGLHFLERAYGVILSKIQNELEGRTDAEYAPAETVSTEASVYYETPEETSEPANTVNILV